MATQKRKNALKIHRYKKDGKPYYKYIGTKKEATKTEYFKQFVNDDNLPFTYKDLTKGEKLSFTALRRVKIGTKFINKEKEDKIKYHVKTKGIELKNNDAKNIKADVLKDILTQEKKVWRNSQQVLKDMIDKHKRGVKVKIKFKGNIYEGLNAINIFSQYVDFLEKKAVSEGKKHSHALFLTKQK